MKYCLSIILISLATCVCAQQTCQVATRAIQGKYIGGCKRGFADGEGTATGLYTYTGEFKKGFPNGKGTITWNEDSLYVGGWKKGEMSGKGILVVRGDTTEGFWSQNEYIGIVNYRYRLISFSNEVGKVMFTRTNSGMNRIQIRFEKETYALPHDNLIIVVKEGSWNRNIVGNAYVKVLENVVFPFQANISGEFEFIITQPGDWEILVLITPTRN